MELIKDPIKEYNFPPHKRGDTVYERNFIINTVAGNPPSSPISDVKLELKKDGKIYHRYSVNDANITLLADNSFRINSHILNIPDGFYNYDLQVIYADGTIKTYLRGVWRIFEDYTK